MAMSAAYLLSAVETLILQRINGGGYDRYSEQEHSFGGATLSELMRIRSDLQQQVAAEAGTSFGLLEPFDA